MSEDSYSYRVIVTQKVHHQSLFTLFLVGPTEFGTSIKGVPYI